MKFPQDEMKRAKKIVRHFLERKEELRPLFYVITGSHRYGFASESSDIDIRGVHIAPGEDYMKINKPAEQYRLNSESEGYEQFDDCDFVSYELRKFGMLLGKMNFNVLEMIDGFYITEPRKRIDQIYDELKPFIKNETPKHYLGMAKQNYYKYLADEWSDSYKPIPKKYLYVFRGLLGAIYSHERGEIEPNLLKLVDKVAVGHEHIILKLVEYKKKGIKDIPEDICERAESVIEDEMLSLDTVSFGDTDKGELRRTIDEWMMEVREDPPKGVL